MGAEFPSANNNQGVAAHEARATAIETAGPATVPPASRTKNDTHKRRVEMQKKLIALALLASAGFSAASHAADDVVRLAI